MVIRRPDGAEVELTAKEMRIVALLANAPNFALSRTELRAQVWNRYHVGRKTLDVHLSRLRAKLARVGLEVRAVGEDRVLLGPIAKDREDA